MRKRLKWLIKALIILISGLLLISGLFFLAVSTGVFGPLPGRAELADIHNEEASLVYASDGTLIGKYFAENRTNISWDEIPPHLIDALIATEDKRFYLHEGVDSRSYLRVFFKTIMLGDRSSGGGSTITQQLIKNLLGREDHSFLSIPVNKLKEAILASRMEDVLTKEDILLLYLNSVPFGEDVYGIEAAAMRYFDKHTAELNIQESALLVGILKANTYYNPRINPENAIDRRNQVLSLMQAEDYLSSAQSDSLKALSLELQYANYKKESPAGYFVFQVKKRVNNILDEIETEEGTVYDLEKDGLSIYTSLDIGLQQSARNAAKTHLNKMQKLLDNELEKENRRKQWQDNLQDRFDIQELKDLRKRELFDWDGLRTEEISYADSLWHYHKMLNAAVLITEASTGRVLGWVGGNHYRYLPYDMVFAERQIASAIKPIIYTSALENGLTPCSYLRNEVVEYQDFNNWRPENYDNSSNKDSLVALWYSLANSLNLPTVDLYFQTGHDNVTDMLRRFELNPPIEETPAVALGSLDVSLYEIVKAYGVFADNGEICEDLVMIDKIEDADGNIIYSGGEQKTIPVILPGIAGEINSILQMAIEDGTGAQLRYHYGIESALAGKTGTAQNYSDAWFLAYTPQIIIGTWVGARSPDMHFQNGLGSGSALALPICGEILSDIEDQPALKKKYLVDFQNELEARTIFDCEPFYEKGLSGFFKRLIGKQADENDLTRDTTRQEETSKKKKKGKVRKFFENIFKKEEEK